MSFHTISYSTEPDCKTKRFDDFGLLPNAKHQPSQVTAAMLGALGGCGFYLAWIKNPNITVAGRNPLLGGVMASLMGAIFASGSLVFSNALGNITTSSIYTSVLGFAGVGYLYGRRTIKN